MSVPALVLGGPIGWIVAPILLGGAGRTMYSAIEDARTDRHEEMREQADAAKGANSFLLNKLNI